MSYAIESKKRKFDRILESLTEGITNKTQTPESNTALNPRNNNLGSRVSSLDSSKRRRVTPTSIKSPSNTSLLSHYLPSSRAAFLERLETYRHVTKWHVPSTIAINAAEWAKRGWICADVDTVACSSCCERVVVDLAVNLRHESRNGGQDDEEQREGENTQEDEDDMVVEVYEALVKRYHGMIITSHTTSCPWRKRGCDSSIQRIEGLLNSSSAVASLRSRLEGILDRVEDLPAASELPSLDDLPTSNHEVLQELGTLSANIPACKLATCGWQYKEADVVECKNCFRSLGLWLYRGAHPTVENLDAVESHLEYCPWRSSDAQDTEVFVHLNAADAGSKKVKLPGWALVYLAIRKNNLKRKGGTELSSLSVADVDGADADREQMTPEQREKKMRDLMRRIKEIKKPFNVKSLLRKKDRSAV